MPESIITMQDMGTIFLVTDALGIHRESVSVELSKEDPGSIGRDGRGKIEITVPASGTVEEFAQRLRTELEAMGYAETDVAEEDDEF
ncbi:MAG TPA: hypothetical protein VFA32_12840 [Dehalococcoidia bacterium]|jgi:hypothetical protein|nr:hypothetical protein [Dehalococcoidia bacterium]